jgi:hypothetical protein
MLRCHATWHNMASHVCPSCLQKVQWSEDVAEVDEFSGKKKSKSEWQPYCKQLGSLRCYRTAHGRALFVAVRPSVRLSRGRVVCVLQNAAFFTSNAPLATGAMTTATQNAGAAMTSSSSSSRRRRCHVRPRQHCQVARCAPGSRGRATRMFVIVLLIFFAACTPCV